MEKTWEQKVQERAHAIWEREGRPENAREEHWARAEEELRNEEEAGKVAAGRVVETVPDSEQGSRVEEKRQPNKRTATSKED